MFALSDRFERYVLGVDGRYMTTVAVDDTRQPQHKDKVLIMTTLKGREVAEAILLNRKTFYFVKYYGLDGEAAFEGAGRL